MTTWDKVGNVSGPDADKRIAQPRMGDSHPLDSESVSAPQSRRGVGHHWENSSKHNMPVLFGAGGEQDGATALIHTSANKQLEDSFALHGCGDDALEQNRYQRNQANANTEFNFSQYKSGALHTTRGSVFPGEGLFTIGSTDGLWSGDTTLRIDPYSDIVDMTTQAVGASFGGIYASNKTGVDQTQGGQNGVNPFRHRLSRADKEKDDDAEADMKGAITQVEEEEDGYDIDYYFDEQYYEAEKAEDQVENDFDTGLRRVNMKTSQGRQLEKVATKEEIMSAYQSANNNYAQVLKDNMGKAYLSSEEKTETLEKLRAPNSKYQVNQMGVNDLSRRTSQNYRQKGTTKLNGVLVGV